MVQIPYVDGAETAKLYPLQRYPQALKLSSQDYMGSKMGLNPKRLPVVDQFKLCFMPTADSYYGYLSIVNPDYYWSGEVPARVFNLMRYRPIQLVRQINIPVLFIAAQHDSLIPIESSREAATNIAPFVSYHEWDMKHFDIYHGAWFEKAVTTQLNFTSTYRSDVNDYCMCIVWCKNRVPEENLVRKSSCGQCHQPLLPLAPIELNEQNFSNYITNSDLPILIDLWAEWCGPCKMMAPHFAQVAKQNPRVIFAKINTEESPRLSQAFNVRSIPTLVLMNKTTEVARMSGALRAPELQQWLDQQLQTNFGS